MLQRELERDLDTPLGGKQSPSDTVPLVAVPGTVRFELAGSDRQLLWSSVMRTGATVPVRRDLAARRRPDGRAAPAIAAMVLVLAAFSARPAPASEVAADAVETAALAAQSQTESQADSTVTPEPVAYVPEPRRSAERRPPRYRLGGSSYVVVPGALFIPDPRGRDARGRALPARGERLDDSMTPRRYARTQPLPRETPAYAPRNDGGPGRSPYETRYGTQMRAQYAPPDASASENMYRNGPPRDGYRYRWSGPRYGVWIDDPRLAYRWRRE
jgi:hypothetical protein